MADLKPHEAFCRILIEDGLLDGVKELVVFQGSFEILLALVDLG